ncbi:MAG: family 43 glycosylhydrolase [Pseudomonadota bacterium]
MRPWFATAAVLMCAAQTALAEDQSLARHYLQMSPPMVADQWHIHDPSRIVTREDGSQIVAATGKAQDDGYRCGLEVWARDNSGADWQPDECIFIDKPAWVGEELPDNSGAFWAPDLLDAQTLFYSISNDGDDARNGTCVGAARKVDGRWRDIGQPISCIFSAVDDREMSSIDPSILQTADGQLVLVTGGGTVHATELDRETLMPVGGNWFSTEDHTWHMIARGPIIEDEQHWVEAAHMYERDGAFYLFVNWGSCCAGVASTYEIRVGRSEDVFGPFLDQQGQDIMDGGGTLVLAARDHEIGPGHATIYTAPTGDTSISYHYYDARRDGLPWIGEAEIEWRDGWPVVP